MRLYYAQNKEDLFIKSFFPDTEKGFYIDVGANNPVVDSVTKLLYDEGWSGINIEPIDKHIYSLRKARPRDINLQVGLSDKPGKLKFTEYPEGDGLSTFDTSMSRAYAKGNHPFPTKKAKEYEVTVKTLQTVIEENNVHHIHFIKIDVEGYEYEVINGYDWKIIRPELICVEANHTHKNKDWRRLLKKHEYEQVFFDGINDYYLSKESMYRKKHFNYPDIVFAGNPMYYPAYKEIVDEQKKLSEEITRPLNGKIQDQEQQIINLQKQQRDVRFLAKRLYAELQIRINKRAKRLKQPPGLIYTRDEQLTKILNTPPSSKEELEDFIKKRDQLNIRVGHGSTGNIFTLLFWKVIARLFNFMGIFIKRLRART